jgi:hypothetical protein
MRCSFIVAPCLTFLKYSFPLRSTRFALAGTCVIGTPFTNQKIVGVGIPPAAHANFASVPSTAVVSVGCAIQYGALSTFNLNRIDLYSSGK